MPQTPIALTQRSATIKAGRLLLAPESDKRIRHAEPRPVVYALPVASGAWEIGCGTLRVERTGGADEKGRPVFAEVLERDVVLASSDAGRKLEPETLAESVAVMVGDAVGIPAPDVVRDIAGQLKLNLEPSTAADPGDSDEEAADPE